VRAVARNIDEAEPASCELGMCSDGRWQNGMSRLDGVEACSAGSSLSSGACCKWPSRRSKRAFDQG
jgi:hypothetical protein